MNGICNDGGYTIFNFNFTNFDYIFKLNIADTGIKMPLLQKIGGDIRIGGKSYFNGWNNLHGVLNGEIILGIHEGLVYVYHDANVTGLQIALHATRSPVTVDEFLEYLSTIAF